jgi:hypothetical protein
MELRYSWHELQQFIEAILNHNLALASSICGLGDTKRAEFESVTEWMLYDLNEVHSIASSSGPPFIIRLGRASKTVE